ncbi:uncharacterized protein LOC118883628 [Balaenoptera musculus]|uniref:Uncharacterized protein LOC118883628 n=1 Tax=Balaenoptera musculus TaxID=9771 RepID=A0A8B8VNR9_BALMU|nr:uncharacterized protein LOC118883628 [Balaenoptera musculus]
MKVSYGWKGTLQNELVQRTTTPAAILMLSVRAEFRNYPQRQRARRDFETVSQLPHIPRLLYHHWRGANEGRAENFFGCDAAESKMDLMQDQRIQMADCPDAPVYGVQTEGSGESFSWCSERNPALCGLISLNHVDLDLRLLRRTHGHGRGEEGLQLKSEIAVFAGKQSHGWASGCLSEACWKRLHVDERSTVADGGCRSAEIDFCLF